MAQIVVDSRVMRDKAASLEGAAGKISALYDEMLKDVQTTASRMQGQTITAQKEAFERMQPVFETIAQDMRSYSRFLSEAAEFYESAEQEELRRAEQQGKVF